MDIEMLCRHCDCRRANSHRGLCWTCYVKPGVRVSYPCTSKFGKFYTDFYGGNDPPPVPTTAAPGSPAKIAIMAHRAALKRSLWHPLDSTADPDLHGRTNFTLTVSGGLPCS